MNYVKNTKKAGDIYMLPIKPPEFIFDKFRLYTGALIFVDYKSHPYKDIELIEWYKRITLAVNYYKTMSCQSLEQIQKEYRVNYVVLEKGAHKESTCPLFETEYEDANYKLYKIRKI